MNSEGFFSAWEGVVLIPFIDERRLLSAIDSLDTPSVAAQLAPAGSGGVLPPLSASEQARNERYGPELVLEFDPSNTAEVVASPWLGEEEGGGGSVSAAPAAFVRRFPPIVGACSKVTLFTLPTHSRPTTAVAAAAAADSKQQQAAVHPAIAVSGDFEARPLKGWVQPIAGHPSLHFLPLTGKLSKVCVVLLLALCCAVSLIVSCVRCARCAVLCCQ